MKNSMSELSNKQGKKYPNDKGQKIFWSVVMNMNLDLVKLSESNKDKILSWLKNKLQFCMR